MGPDTVALSAHLALADGAQWPAILAGAQRLLLENYGIDHVMYGTDYPCWDPATALALLNELGLSKEDQDKLFYSNARRILGLRDPAPGGVQQGVREPALT